MKRTIVHAVAFFGLMFLSSGLMAQENPKVGLKGGMNISNLIVDDIDDENARIGFHAGIFAQLLSSEAFAIQPELLYSTRGNRVETDIWVIDQETKFNLNYLDIPVLAVFKLGEAFEIHAGPYWSYLLNANISSDGDLGDSFNDLDRDNFESWDMGLSGGIAVNFSNLQLGARYNYGLREIAKSDGAELILGDSKNSMGQIYLAINLNNR